MKGGWAIGPYLSMTALSILMHEPRFARFTRAPVVVSIEIREPREDETGDDYSRDILEPAIHELIICLPLDLVQFVDPPKADKSGAVEAESVHAVQGFSVQYRKHYNVVRAAMLSTLSVAYIPAS